MARPVVISVEDKYRLVLSAVSGEMSVAESVRGWAAVHDQENWIGRKILSVQETPEMIPGPSRLTKVVMEDGDGT